MECPQGQEERAQDLKSQTTTYCGLVAVRDRLIESHVEAESFSRVKAEIGPSAFFVRDQPAIHFPFRNELRAGRTSPRSDCFENTGEVRHDASMP